MNVDHEDLHFGAFTLDARAPRLLKGHTELHITPKAHSVLMHLVRGGGGLVTRAELFNTHWAGKVVTDDALSRCIRELRALVEDNPRKPVHIVTVHTRGYRFATPVTATAARGQPSQAAAAPEFDPGRAGFVGRQEYLDRVRPLLRACVGSGTGAVIEVSGEPGIGKSRFARRLCAEATSLGMTVVVALASEVRGAPPYWLWIQVLRAFASTARHANEANHILALLSANGAPATGGRNDYRYNPEAARFHVRDMVTRFLIERADAEPLVLLMEDLHAAEPDCLQLLSALAQTINEVPLVILTTFRDVGAPINPALQQLVADLARSTATHALIPLRRLDEAELKQLLTLHMDSDTASRISDLAMRKSGGNPLYLNELLALPITDIASADATHAAWALEQPESIRQLLNRRIDTLSSPCRSVLTTAAVIGNSFAVRTLLRCRLYAEGALSTALDEACRQRLLLRTPTRADEWRFSHGLVRETLYEALSATERAAGHLRVAEAIEALNTGNIAAPAAELAWHYAHATPSAQQRRKTTAYLERAAEHAFKANAFSEAAQHYDTLREWLLQADELDSAALCRATMGAAINYGNTARVDVARAHAVTAHQLALSTMDAGLMVRAVLLRCGLEPSYPPQPQLVNMIDAVLATIGADLPAGRAALLAQRGFQHYVLGNVDAVQVDARAALALARRENNDDTLDVCLETCCYAFGQPWFEDEWRNAYTERIGLAKRRQDVRAEFDARLHRLEHLMQIGPRAAMEAELQRLLPLCTQLNTPGTRAAALRIQTGLALARGELAEAWRLAPLAYAEGKASTDSGTADAFALLHFGNLLGLRGDVAQVAAGVENDEIVSHNSILLAGRVYTHCTTGRWDSAQARLDHFAESNFARIPRDMTYGLALSNLAISCMLLRDRARAALLRPMLAPYANRNLTALCYYTAGCGAHFLGLIDGCMGEWKTANDHFEASIAMNREMGFRLPLATTLTAYAQACRRQGKRMQLRADALQKAAADLLRTMAIPASAILAFDAARPPGIS